MSIPCRIGRLSVGQLSQALSVEPLALPLRGPAIWLVRWWDGEGDGKGERRRQRDMGMGSFLASGGRASFDERIRQPSFGWSSTIMEHTPGDESSDPASSQIDIKV